MESLCLPCLDSANLSSTLPLDLSLWHRRFGHSNHDYVKQLHANDMVTGMTLSNKSKPDPICEPCLAGKMHANPFPTSYSRASQPLELVHIDLKGPIQVTSFGGYKYWAMFVDDHTRFKCGIGLKKKIRHLLCILAVQSLCWETCTMPKLKTIREDKGSEFMSNEFNQFCIDNGIQREHTVRNRPQQNGDAEESKQNCIWSYHCHVDRSQSTSSILVSIVSWPWCMFSTDLPLLLSLGRHPMKLGTTRNLMYLISEYGDA